MIWSKRFGQYELYRIYLELLEPDRELFLAISSDTYRQFFQREAMEPVLQVTKIKLVIIDLTAEEAVEWIS